MTRCWRGCLAKANVLQAIGDVQQFRKEMDAALASYAAALSLFRQVGAKLGEANVLAAQSLMYIGDNEDRAQALLAAALDVYRAIGDVYSEGARLYNYGLALLNRDRYSAALPYFTRARELFASRGLDLYVGYADDLIAKIQARLDAGAG